ncbi:hypothetical protein BK816_00080 [Boudabousia tangfeifanii]|uniref:DUF881 domain-containing protein n=1 Tax=Boudabousia tangfeifanii TaxID=1912795 RepID=A0A1D9MHU3_9ACTO|nr:DUF881 domain-containing protein [Boudabousia tangfeifanii]AOZ71881.1 hypothetical protein BK816_00080 [Boudabousia tangfeifanii]
MSGEVAQEAKQNANEASTLAPTPQKAHKGFHREHRHPAKNPTKPFARIRMLTAVTMIVAGVIMGTSAKSSVGVIRTHSNDVKGLVRTEMMVNEKTRHHNEKLKQQIAEAEAKLPKEVKPSDEELLASATAPVIGPGVTVKLWDAPEAPDKENPDIYVIHQQDIEGVMNALWNGGAEAMTVQGQRIAVNSRIRCVGNVIYVDGTVYSPPFVISAIGDPKKLQKSLTEDETMRIYQQYVDKYGLGYSEEAAKQLKFPAIPQLPNFEINRNPEAK